MCDHFSARWENGEWKWTAKQPAKPNKTCNPKAKEVRVSEDQNEEGSDEKESGSDNEDPKGPGWELWDPATSVQRVEAEGITDPEQLGKIVEVFNSYMDNLKKRRGGVLSQQFCSE